MISNGRFELGVGVGYRVEEFESFGIPKAERGRRTTEALEIIRGLLDGETVTVHGQFYFVDKAKIAPASAQRVAKFADGFIAVASPSPDLFGQYVSALQALGKPTTDLMLAGRPFWLIPSSDPEKTWNEAAPHVLYQRNLFAAWLEKSGMPILPHLRDIAHLKEVGLLNVVDVGICIATVKGFASSVPLTHFYTFTLPPGLPANWVQPHLELFAGKVIPAFR